MLAATNFAPNATNAAQLHGKALRLKTSRFSNSSDSGVKECGEVGAHRKAYHLAVVPLAAAFEAVLAHFLICTLE